MWRITNRKHCIGCLCALIKQAPMLFVTLQPCGVLCLFLPMAAAIFNAAC
jgi:hypothetical protein